MYGESQADGSGPGKLSSLQSHPITASEAKKFLSLGRELQQSQSRLKMSTDGEEDFQYGRSKDGSMS